MDLSALSSWFEMVTEPPLTFDRWRNGEEDEETITGPIAVVPIRVSTRVMDHLSGGPESTLLNALHTTPFHAHFLDERPNVSVSILSDPA